MDDVERQLAQLGKGMVQVSLRLNRVLELVEGGGRARAEDAPTLELALDLIEAIDQTLATARRPVELTRWQRWLGVSPPSVDLEGLALARSRAVQRLGEAGVLPTPLEGAVDVRLHRVIETLPCADPALDGHIARTHTHGWHRAGDPPTAIRTALVSVWQHKEA